MRSDGLPIKMMVCCDDRDSGGRPDRWLGGKDLMMLLDIGGVGGARSPPFLITRWHRICLPYSFRRLGKWGCDRIGAPYGRTGSKSSHRNTSLERFLCGNVLLGTPLRPPSSSASMVLLRKQPHPQEFCMLTRLLRGPRCTRLFRGSYTAHPSRPLVDLDVYDSLRLLNSPSFQSPAARRIVVYSQD